MGDRLVEYYSKAKEKRGMEGKIKLAMLTKMSSAQAKESPDSPENIKLFEEAIAQIE